MAKKNIPINYTNRDFDSIKEGLVEYAKRYYPDNFKDFNEASFGSLMLDTVAYVGDIMSFYLDYQVNESFIDSANEYDNIVRLARQLGYKLDKARTSFGVVSFFLRVPASSTTNGPDQQFMPILKKGTTLSSDNGNIFTLVENIDFSDTRNSVVVSTVNTTTGVPTEFAIKAHGRVISGLKRAISYTVGDYEKFLKIRINDKDATEILSVMDDQGTEYFEVDYLSQDTIYKSFPNRGSDSELVGEILKPVIVPRRFTVEKDDEGMFLQFGFGSETDIVDNSVADPAKITLQMHGKDYVTDRAFDPTRLLSTEKLGIVPANVDLTITYRANTTTNTNAAVNTITNVVGKNFSFGDQASLNQTTLGSVMDSLEVTNEEPVNSLIQETTADEIRVRALDSFATQNRAVTQQDYVNFCYRMPAKFGAIKRANIYQDKNSFKRNMNLYVIGQDVFGKLATLTDTAKQNLKTWLQKHKMLNDTIDILDAFVVNLSIEFVVVAEKDFDSVEVFDNCMRNLKEELELNPGIGEEFSITEIYKILNRTRGVVDAVDVTIRQKTGDAYSDISYNVSANTSADGRRVYFPQNVIYEIKHPDMDIKGEVR